MLCSLSVLILFVGSLFQTLDLSAAAAAGLTVIFAMIELGKKHAFLIYAASSLLALVLLPNKSPAVIFAAFAGLYPIIKAYLQRIRIRSLIIICKLILFNIFFTVIIVIGRYLLGLTEDFYLIGFDIIGGAVYLLGNAVFFIYDYALDRLVALYTVKLKRIFDNNFKV